MLCTDPGTRQVARDMMIETQEVAEKLGVKLPIGVTDGLMVMLPWAHTGHQRGKTLI